MIDLRALRSPYSSSFAGIAAAGTEPSSGHESAPDAITARSPYADERGRKIESLSLEDVVGLRRGGGWGRARMTELDSPFRAGEIAA